MGQIGELREELRQAKARRKDLEDEARKHKLWEKVDLILRGHAVGMEHQFDEKTHVTTKKYGKLKLVDSTTSDSVYQVYYEDFPVLKYKVWVSKAGRLGELKGYNPGSWEKDLQKLYKNALEVKLREDIMKVSRWE